jgi:hypothetical protein
MGVFGGGKKGCLEALKMFGYGELSSAKRGRIVKPGTDVIGWMLVCSGCANPVEDNSNENAMTMSF